MLFEYAKGNGPFSLKNVKIKIYKTIILSCPMFCMGVRLDLSF
jgi:hypothetical protein